MIIVGEKINGTIPSVQKAIEEREEEFIYSLAVKQAKAGADYIDVCAGTEPAVEVEALMWLMEIVQDAVDLPLCIDSPNPRVIEQVFLQAKQPGIVNSVSAEKDKCDIIYPLLQGTEWQAIGLTCDNSGIPGDVQTRVEIAGRLVETAGRYGISPDRLHIDPLVIALSTDNQSMLKFMKAAWEIKEACPSVKITSGLSNISFGMPLRRVVNQGFLTLAMYAGMDSAIMDPCNQEMMATLLATEALLGRDKFCRKFSNAYRKGSIGAKKQ
ncbi:MAG: methyltetrahydrofolate cobalamin methyltransferase [Thermacetogeniaceae bacterium]